MDSSERQHLGLEGLPFEVVHGEEFATSSYQNTVTLGGIILPKELGKQGQWTDNSSIMEKLGSSMKSCYGTESPIEA